MSLADTRAAIVARLAAVPGIGVVHAYERFAADQKKFRDLYTGAPGLLQGWFVSLGGAREVSAVVGLATQVAGWRLQGFRAIDDDGASELAFAGLIEAAVAAFRADETLGGAVFDLSDATLGAGEKPTGLQLDKIEPVMFCGVLCHGARLSLTTSQQIRY